MRLPAVTSLGLITAVGHDVVTACAASRAGIVRFAPLPGVTACDPDELEAPVVGAPVEGVTDGFIQTGRWLALATAAVADAIRFGALPSPDDHGFWSRTALLWALPEVSHERFLWPELEVSELLESSCSDALERLSGLSPRRLPAAQAYVCEGALSLASALQRLDALAARERLERALVLAVDSWLDPLSLAVLERERRLKTTERPAGLIPGEAAAALVLEARRPRLRDGSGPGATVLATSVIPAPPAPKPGAAPAARMVEAPATGRRVATAIAEVMSAAHLRPPLRGDLLLDLNGEPWKSEAWGHALVQLQAGRWLGTTRDHLPARSWGDAGSATAAGCVCLAARAFARGYASGDHALVLSISERGGVGAILVGRPERPA